MRKYCVECRTEATKFQLVKFFTGHEVIPVCNNHTDEFTFFSYTREESTFDSYEEAQVALIKRSL